MTTKYDHEVAHHDPKEGFDRSELDARKITLFVIVSVVTLVVTIMALQSYFDKIWNEAVYQKVLAVPGEEVGDMRALSAWRLSHYEYADPTKTAVRMPFDRAKELFLAEQAAGKTFYPAKPTEPIVSAWGSVPCHACQPVSPSTHKPNSPIVAPFKKAAIAR